MVIRETPPASPAAPAPLGATAGARAGVADLYLDRRGRFARDRDRLTARWNRVANLRAVSFLLGAACLIWALWRQAPLLAVPGVVSLAGFVALVIYQHRLGLARRRADGLRAINDEADRRVRRAWDELPPSSGAAAPGHPYGGDLDVTGHASLLQLLDTTGAAPGAATLRGWLLEPAPPETIRRRQAAVRDLAPLLDLRQELILSGRLAGDASADPEPFLRWAEGERWLARRPALRWAARLGPPLFWALLILWFAAVVPYPLWLLCLLLNGAVNRLTGGVPYRILAQVAEQEGAFRHYARSFQVLAGASFATPALRDLRAALTASGVSAYDQMRRLQRLRNLVIPRASLAYGLLQALTLWDLQVLAALERWQVTAGSHAREWLATLGEIEALAALGALAHDNPAWTFPEIDTAATAVESTELGHPLLPEDVRVVNDVTVGPAGTFLLVTGSNMSGKSTLLRAIGVNVVLANAGGPVCARACRLPPVALWTGMRVQDSLERGVSYFMAELQRLKQVVDAARPGDRPDHGRRVLYLLDEILQGTNTVERQVAARRIIRFLVASGALGAVSTHDLGLADPREAPDLAAAARPVHFTETIATGPDGPTMSFDYRLRPGIATSTNALRLMEIVGLTFEGEEPGGR